MKNINKVPFFIARFFPLCYLWSLTSIFTFEFIEQIQPFNKNAMVFFIREIAPNDTCVCVCCRKVLRRNDVAQENCISNEWNNIKFIFKTNRPEEKMWFFYVSIFWLIPIHHPQSKLQFMKCNRQSDDTQIHSLSISVSASLLSRIKCVRELAICFSRIL